MMIVFFFTMITAAYLIWAPYRLYHQYRLPYLRAYLVFLASWCAFGLLGHITVVFGSQVLAPQTYRTVALLNILFIFPVMAVLLYSFITFTSRLVNLEPSRLFKRFFAILMTVIFVFIAAGTFYALSRPAPPSPLLAFPAGRLLKGLFFYGALVRLLVKNRGQKQPAGKKKTIKLFAVIMMAGYTLAELGMMGKFPVDSYLLATALTNGCYYGCQLAGFLLIKSMTKHFEEMPGGEETSGSEDMQVFLDRYGISKREGEIVQLILAGKSNRDIEETLYISLETVKKHIYNIYKKTGVKSRVQLSNLVARRDDLT